MKLNYINIYSIINSKINDNIFPYITLDTFINKEYINNILDNFPKNNLKGSIYISDLILDKHHSNLINEFESNEFKNIISKKLNINLDNAYPYITYRFISSIKDGKIHVDSKDKLITILLYLNPNWDNKNGKLRLLYNKYDIDNYIDEISPIANSCLIFKVTDNCWHGYNTYVGKRQSIQINYINI